MKCRICGRDCPPGAKICRDCAAARKRAFAQTVTLPLLAAVGAPSVAEPRFAPKPARSRAANDSKVERVAPRVEPSPALPLTVVPRRFGALWLLVAVAVTATVVLLLVHTTGTPNHVTDEATTTTPPAAPVAAVPSPAPRPVIAQTMPDRVPSEASVKTAPVRPQRRVASHVETPVVVAPPPLPPEPVPVARAPSPSPQPIEAPRVDPMQALNEGLLRCSHEALFDRMACEQRIRTQYCGNSWGVAAQCPIGPGTDHGQ